MQTVSAEMGRRQGTTVQFKGLRYAAAERYAPPELVPFEGALAEMPGFTPYALQNRTSLEKLIFGVDYGAVRQREDCQYLSVTVPLQDGAMPDGLPVMVWFHGGAFSNGGADNRAYDPVNLAEEGKVIVVSVNYRLGILGFVRDAAGHTGHPGLLDQIAALQWVTAHIERFGGDPTKVCIFGQSAGGTSVHSLLLSVGDSGLFRRAIIQSAPFGTLIRRSPMDEAIRAQVLDLPEDAGPEALLECQLMAEKAVRERGNAHYMHFAPHAGVAPLPPADRSLDAYARAAEKVDLLIGANTCEPSIYMAHHPWFPKAVQTPYLGQVLRRVLRFKSDAIFGKGARRVATDYAQVGGRTYFYECSWGEDGSVYGGCHCAEMPLVFGADLYMGSPLLMNKSIAEVDRVGQRVRRIWTDFAKTGVIQTLAIPGCIQIKPL